MLLQGCWSARALRRRRRLFFSLPAPLLVRPRRFSAGRETRSRELPVHTAPALCTRTVLRAAACPGIIRRGVHGRDPERVDRAGPGRAGRHTEGQGKPDPATAEPGRAAPYAAPRQERRLEGRPSRHAPLRASGACCLPAGRSATPRRHANRCRPWLPGMRAVVESTPSAAPPRRRVDVGVAGNRDGVRVRAPYRRDKAPRRLLSDRRSGPAVNT